MVDESIFSDEELMSFADGELSEPDNERILLAMASDSSLKARVESFRLSANLLRTSLSVEGNSTPDHIKHRIREIQKSPIRSVETEVEKPLYLKLRRLFDFSFLVPATAIFACGIILSPIIGFGNFGDEDALGLVATRGVSQSISNEGLIDFFDIQAIQRGVSIPNNGAIVENVPFIISFKSAFAGSATIYEVTEGVDGFCP